MISSGYGLQIRRHIVVIVGIVLSFLPIYAAVDAASHTFNEVTGKFPIWFGTNFISNFYHVLVKGIGGAGTPAVWHMLLNSSIMALGISLGKIIISLPSAYAVVYFRFPFRKTFFWLIFITLMLPVQVRILPTYKVITDLDMLNSYTGLIVPLIASATATFFFSQSMQTIPDEMLEAARLDGAGPIRFLFDFVIPLSWTVIAAIFVVEFIYGWNLYLWPLIITTNKNMYTIVIGLQNLASVNLSPHWNLIMAVVILAILPPLIVIIFMQRFFVEGLIQSDK